MFLQELPAAFPCPLSDAVQAPPWPPAAPLAIDFEEKQDHGANSLLRKANGPFRLLILSGHGFKAVRTTFHLPRTQHKYCHLFAN